MPDAPADSVSRQGGGATIRIPIRRFTSGTTHLADISADHETVGLTAWGADFEAPIGPIETLCMVTLQAKEVLIHMREMGSAKTDPKGCQRCLRLAARNPREVIGYVTPPGPPRGERGREGEDER
jgi:hypothetical protein